MKTILYHITKTWIEEDIVFKRNLVSLPFSSHLTALQPQSRTQTTKHQIQFVWIDPTHLNMCWNDTTVQSNSIIFDLSSLFLFSFVMPSVFGCTSYFIGGGFQTLKRKVAVQLLLLHCLVNYWLFYSWQLWQAITQRYFPLLSFHNLIEIHSGMLVLDLSRYHRGNAMEHMSEKEQAN